jgi:hypothetical protein
MWGGGGTFNTNITCKVFPLENINIFKKFQSQLNIYFFYFSNYQIPDETLKLCLKLSNNLYLRRTKAVSQFKKDFC